MDIDIETLIKKYRDGNAAIGKTATAQHFSDLLESDKLKLLKEKTPLMASFFPENFQRSEIFPFQCYHIAKMIGIFNEWKYHFDTSITGMGKTICSIVTALCLGYRHFVVVCPLIVVKNWENYFLKKEIAEHVKGNYYIVSYDTLRGAHTGKDEDVHEKMRGRGIFRIYSKKIKYLNTKGKELTQVIYECVPTLHYLKMTKNGFALILDEFHRGKNPTITNAVMACLVNAITMTENPSRCFFLSRTPGNTGENARMLMQILGICDSKAPSYVPSEGKATFPSESSLGQIVTYLQSDARFSEKNVTTGDENDVMDLNEFIETLREKTPGGMKDSKGGTLYYYRNFFIFIKRMSSNKIPDAVFYDIVGREKLDIGNIYIPAQSDQENSELDAIASEINNLAALLIQGKLGNNPNYTRKKINAKFQKAFTELEVLMIPGMVKEAIGILKKNPNAKVVVAVNRYEAGDIFETVEQLFNEEGYVDNVIEISGKVKGPERFENVMKFNEPNNDIRIIIGTIQAIYQGIDLHDQSEGGKYPRYTFISPSHVITYLLQIVGRFVRIGLTSKVQTVICYPAIFDIDKNIMVKRVSEILQKINEKGDQMSEMIANEDEEGDVEVIENMPSEWAKNHHHGMIPDWISENTEIHPEWIMESQDHGGLKKKASKAKASKAKATKGKPKKAAAKGKTKK